jgi:hypothetical protein
MTYFAYVHARPTTTDQHGIFYVGKGTSKRHLELAGRNAHHANVINKYGSENILIGKLDCSSEQIAFDLEIGLIKCLRRNGVKLANMTNGGEGSAGYIPTEEAKRKVSKALAGIVRTPEFGAKISASKMNHSVSQETRNKISKTKAGQPGHNKGKAMSDEQKLKLSICNLGKKLSDETKLKITNALKGRSNYWLRGTKHSEERKMKISNKLKGRVSPNKGKTLSDEAKKIRSEKITLSWINRRAANVNS